MARLPLQLLAGEAFTTLVDRPGLRIDRIVSTGQTTPEGQWHDQETDEWVLMMEGAARLRVHRALTEGEGESEGWILLPAHCRHRVTLDASQSPTVWLAVHFVSDQ